MLRLCCGMLTKCCPAERNKSLLKTLMVMVEGLVEQFYPSANKDLRRYVPCSHCYARIKHTKGGTMEVSFERENSVHLFTYEECLEALAAGNTVIECPNEGMRTHREKNTAHIPFCIWAYIPS